MIKQDYLIRMIQEIISLIMSLDEMIDCYEGDRSFRLKIKRTTFGSRCCSSVLLSDWHIVPSSYF